MQRPHSLWCAAGSFLLKGSARERGASIHDIRTEGEGVTKSRCMEVTVDLIPNAYREKGTKIQRQFAYVCTKWTTPADISLFILMEQMCNQKKPRTTMHSPKHCTSNLLNPVFGKQKREAGGKNLRIKIICRAKRLGRVGSVRAENP